MGNYGCYNDCSTAELVPLLAISTIVIANYGWFSHKWLLMRPGILLGVVTGLGMILIVMASVCAWLYFVNRLLSVRGKSQKDTSSCGIADGVLLEDEGQQEYNATEIADGYTQDEVQASQHLEYVAAIGTHAKNGIPEDGGLADLQVDYCSQDVSTAGGASDLVSGDGVHDWAQVDAANGAQEASDLITRDAVDAYAQVDYPVGAAWQCSRFSGDGRTFSGDCTIAEEGPLEGIGCDDFDDYTDPFVLDGAPDQHILPANSTIEQENTCMTNQDGMPFFQPCELDDQVDEEGMEHLGFSIAPRDSMEEESQERSRSVSANWESFMPASFSSSLVDDCVSQQNVEDDQACESPCSENYENALDYQSSAVEVEAANGSQNEYSNQLDNEGAVRNDFGSSNPLGDSSSGNQSNTSMKGNANLERTMPIEPMLDTHGTLEEDRMCSLSADRINPSIDSYPAELVDEEMSQMSESEEGRMCAPSTDRINPSTTDSYPAQLFDEEMSQMPELKLVLELAEPLSVDAAMDPLEHINLVFSSLETDADGSLVAVLSQSI